MAESARRVFVCVAPRLLADALVEVLRRTNIDRVFEFDPGSSDPPADEFDVAIVSRGVRETGGARVVITVPRESTPWIGMVAIDGGRPQGVAMSGPGDILEVLDEVCPDPDGRRRRLPSAASSAGT